MPKGSNIKKGMRPGGRKKGGLNKRTIEKVEEARIAVENARGAGKKLAKEVLEDFMHLFARMADAHHGAALGQQTAIQPNGNKPVFEPSEEKFQIYAKLAVDTAKALADFQSPKFRAIMVTAPTGDPEKPMVTRDGNLLTIDDPIAAARVYARIMKAGA